MVCIIFTACGTPPCLFVAFILHLITIILLLTTKKLVPLLTSAIPVTFPGCALAVHPPCTFWTVAHENLDLPGFIDRHIPHFNHTPYFPSPPLFSAWPHHLAPSTQIRNGTSKPRSASRNISLHSNPEPALFLKSLLSFTINNNYKWPPTRHAIIL